jgi:hypothetical protein
VVDLLSPRKEMREVWNPVDSGFRHGKEIAGREAEKAQPYRG